MNRLFNKKKSIHHEILSHQQRAYYNNQQNMSFSENTADTIEIIKPCGNLITSIPSHLSPNLCLDLQKIRNQVIDNYRKLPENCQQDIIELLVQKSYIYYKKHRQIIIIVIAGAEQTIKKIMNAYDQTLMQQFGQYNLPRYLGAREIYKLHKIKIKIKNIIEQQSDMKSSKASQISQMTASFQQKINDIALDTNRQQKLAVIENKNEEVLKRSYRLKNNTEKVSKYQKCRKYLLWVIILINISFAIYFLKIHI